MGFYTLAFGMFDEVGRCDVWEGWNRKDEKTCVVNVLKCETVVDTFELVCEWLIEKKRQLFEMKTLMVVNGGDIAR